MSKIVRYSYGGRAARFGELHGAKIQPLRGTIGSLSQADEPSVDAAQVRLLAPTTPSKVVAIGPGYRVHLKGGPAPARPHYWIKPASALLDPEGTIELPSGVPMVCHESEVAVVIGKVSKDVPIGRAHEHIFGYTCINDVTAGNMVNIPEFLKSQYFVDGKMFDTFCPLGPCIETELSLDNLELECRVNGDRSAASQYVRPAFLGDPARLDDFGDTDPQSGRCHRDGFAAGHGSAGGWRCGRGRGSGYRSLT